MRCTIKLLLKDPMNLKQFSSKKVHADILSRLKTKQAIQFDSVLLFYYCKYFDNS